MALQNTDDEVKSERGQRLPFRAPDPRLPVGVSALLADTCRAAVAGVNRAWSHWGRAELVQTVRIGADDTATYRIDEIVEEAILEAARPYKVNVLSEEVGFIDRGSAATLVIDPLDGSANAAAGVPLSCFSATLFIDDEPVEALNTWLEQGHSVWAQVQKTGGLRSASSSSDVLKTSGRTQLEGAAVDMLRPKRHHTGDSTATFIKISRAAERIRVLSSSCLETMLVAQGAIDAFADPGSQTHRIVDIAAALLLVPAAGGAVLDAYGQPVEFDTDLSRRWSAVIAASPSLARELADTIATNRVDAEELGPGTDRYTLDQDGYEAPLH